MCDKDSNQIDKIENENRENTKNNMVEKDLDCVQTPNVGTKAYINTKRTPREERITNHMYKYLNKTFTFLMPHLAK